MKIDNKEMNEYDGCVGVEKKIQRLREHLGLTQAAFARRADLARAEVNALEAGRNQGSSIRIRQQLAVGAGLELDALNDYLEGRASLAKLFPKPSDLDKALSIDSWPAEVTAAARELESQGAKRSPKEWVTALNAMEERLAQGAGRKTLWDHLENDD